MHNRIYLSGNVQELRHILLDELKIRAAGKVGDVVGRARDQVIDGDDAVAAAEQQIDQVRAEESRAPSNDGGGLGARGVGFAGRGHERLEGKGPEKQW